MRVLRFMSLEEFNAFNAGEVLINKLDHRKDGAKSDAIGFCFLNADNQNPEYAFSFLSGIVSNDVCAVFETNKALKQTTGRFADPDEDVDFLSILAGYYGEGMDIEEFSTTEYSQLDFTLVEWCFNFREARNTYWAEDDRKIAWIWNKKGVTV